ncbi:antitoxin VbhA family protein [Bartonella florencae]|uniref:antitoxin VbhA family protein n=1 Tax=Bartonella florencae TaxID=928210 RepID=UPI0002F78B07|nr:antitoxin VbhA family protein [Bartonella florencae]
MSEKTTQNLLSMTAEELQQRREVVDATINSHALEGIALHSKTLVILEEYAKGNISLEEFNTLMDSVRL